MLNHDLRGVRIVFEMMELLTSSLHDVSEGAFVIVSFWDEPLIHSPAKI